MIIDAHVHISPEFCGEDIISFLDRTDTERAVLQAVFHTKYGPLAPLAMRLKKTHPDRIYVFGSPDAKLYFSKKDTIGKAQIEYLKPFLDDGMDGIKLLEGKPQMRKAYPFPPFDSEAWEPFFSFVEENAIPLMWHVNDPACHWSKDVSPWLIKQGWAYDETFINNEDQYSEVLRVLDRHPKMKVILAHFYFMSGDLGRLSSLLDTHPEVRVDLTPGIEMYMNFSKNIQETDLFFKKYGSRILYGTDTGGRCILTNEGCSFNVKENLLRPEIVREFLAGKTERRIESDGDFLIDREPFTMRPLGLSGERLEKIFCKNLLQML